MNSINFITSAELKQQKKQKYNTRYYNKYSQQVKLQSQLKYYIKKYGEDIVNTYKIKYEDKWIEHLKYDKVLENIQTPF